VRLQICGVQRPKDCYLREDGSEDDMQLLV